MSTATESNTPQPYAEGTYSTPEVGTPSHGRVQPGQQNGPEYSTTSGQSVRGQPLSQLHLPSQSQSNANAVKGGASTQSFRSQHQVDTTGREQPAEEEGGAARGENAGQGSAPPEPEGGYPEQLHAGKLDGVGPEYDATNHVKLSERVQGVKEQIKGAIKRDPNLKQQGKERMTGELKRKQKEEDESLDPFNTAGGDDDGGKDEQADDASQSLKKHKSVDPGDVKDKSRTAQTESGTTETPTSHLTDKGAREQAASINPEGTGSNTVMDG